MGQLRELLATMMTGALEGEYQEGRLRIALKAATRITENFQAELRSRKLAHEMGRAINELGSEPIGDTSKES